MDRSARLAAGKLLARACEADPQRPDAGDVLVAAGIGPLDRSTAGLLLWRKPDVLLAEWDEIEASLGGSAPRDARPAERVSLGGPAPCVSDRKVEVASGGISPAPSTLSAQEPLSWTEESHPDQSSSVAPRSHWLHDPGTFADFDWAQADVSGTKEAGQIQAQVSANGVSLRWRPPSGSGQVTLFRVVQSSENWPSLAPETGTLVGVTTETNVTADLTSTSAVTYLAVWANSGRDELEARTSQPILVAVGEVLWPPTELSATVTPGDEVVASFVARSGPARVEVQRTEGTGTVTYDPIRALPSSDVLPTGFVDRQPPVGVPLTYCAYTVAKLPDERQLVSAPAQTTAYVLPRPESIALAVTPVEGRSGAYDISWSAPDFGRVDIYLCHTQPPTGLSDATRSEEVIARAGLTPDRRLKNPPMQSGRRMTINSCQVDPNWVRGYFVAVHVVTPEAVAVGPIVSVVRPRAPKHLILIERVDSQIVLFAWPEGVRMVEAYQGPRGQNSLDPIASQAIASLTEEEYVRMGGLHITHPLPPNGCTLHLFGVIYDEGQPRRSTGATLEYPGMTRVHYDLLPVWPEGSQPLTGAQPLGFRVVVRSDDVVHGAPFSLVQNPTRLPLHPHDGRHVQNVVVSLTPNIETEVATLQAGQQCGFVRLFLAKPPIECGSIAVLDPSLGRLTVGLA